MVFVQTVCTCGYDFWYIKLYSGYQIDKKKE